MWSKGQCGVQRCVGMLRSGPAVAISRVHPEGISAITLRHFSSSLHSSSVTNDRHVAICATHRQAVSITARRGTHTYSNNSALHSSPYISRRNSSTTVGVAPHPLGTTSSDMSHCILCDTPFTNWVAHCQSSSHVARVAIGEAFVKPERSASMLTQLQEHIGMDFSVVDEATAQKSRRRQRRLRSSLDYLIMEKVLHRCVLQMSPSEPADASPPSPMSSSSSSSSVWCVRDGFMTCAAVGEAHAREHLTDRVARLAPRSSGMALRHMVEYLCAPRQWSRLFDQLQLENLLTATAPLASAPTNTTACSSSVDQGLTGTGASGSFPPASSGQEGVTMSEETEKNHRSSALSRHRVGRLTHQEKSLVLRSCIGELHLFTQRDRSHRVDSKAVTEQLVHHVLASHCVDNLLAELLHDVMETVVQESTPVWRAYRAQEERMRMRAYQAASPLLSPTPNRTTTTTTATTTTTMKGTSPSASLRGFFPPLRRGHRHGEKDEMVFSPSASVVDPSAEEGAPLRAGGSDVAVEGSRVDRILPDGGRVTMGTPATARTTGKRGTSAASMTASGSSSSIPRGPWQEVYRQLLFERPMIPPTTPGASFAPFHPRLHPEPR